MSNIAKYHVQYIKLVHRVFLDQFQRFRRTRFDGALERLGVTATPLDRHRGQTTLPHLMVPDDGSISGVTSTPFSIILDTSKTATDMATESHTDASARCRPVYEI